MLKRALFLILSVLILFMAGCEAYNGKDKVAEKNITSIGVTRYEYETVGEMMEPKITKTWTFTQKEIIDQFMAALNNRLKLNALIDIRPRDYAVELNYSDNTTEQYDLWVDQDENARGVLMQGSDVWEIDAGSKKALYELLR